MPRSKFNPETYVGERFGRLVVERPGGRPYYLYCRCECGNGLNVHASNLRAVVGGTKSCGCLRKDKAAKQMKQKHETVKAAAAAKPAPAPRPKTAQDIVDRNLQKHAEPPTPPRIDRPQIGDITVIGDQRYRVFAIGMPYVRLQNLDNDRDKVTLHLKDVQFIERPTPDGRVESFVLQLPADSAPSRATRRRDERTFRGPDGKNYPMSARDKLKFTPNLDGVVTGQPYTVSIIDESPAPSRRVFRPHDE